MIKSLWNKRLFNIALSNTVRCHPVKEDGSDREPTKEESKYVLPDFDAKSEVVKPVEEEIEIIK